jgi:hypothetical protein
METRGNRSLKLGFQESEDSETEEVVLRVQGIVCSRELPPIRRPFKVYVHSESTCRKQHTHIATDNPTGGHICDSP